jgi:hypothetical protein
MYHVWQSSFFSFYKYGALFLPSLGHVVYIGIPEQGATAGGREPAGLAPRILAGVQITGWLHPFRQA